MTNSQAIEIARFNSKLHEMLTTDDDHSLSQKELMIYIREVLNSQANDVRTERSLLEKELDSLKQ